MIKRTVSGAVVGDEPRSGGTPPQQTQPRALVRWEARDEWGQTVERVVAAIDATAAAELVVEDLVARSEVDAPTTVSVRRVYPIGEWIQVEVDVGLTVEAEISAVRVVSEPRAATRRKTATADGRG